MWAGRWVRIWSVRLGCIVRISKLSFSRLIDRLDKSQLQRGKKRFSISNKHFENAQTYVY